MSLMLSLGLIIVQVARVGVFLVDGHVSVGDDILTNEAINLRSPSQFSAMGN